MWLTYFTLIFPYVSALCCSRCNFSVCVSALCCSRCDFSVCVSDLCCSRCNFCFCLFYCSMPVVMSTQTSYIACSPTSVSAPTSTLALMTFFPKQMRLLELVLVSLFYRYRLLSWITVKTSQIIWQKSFLHLITREQWVMKWKSKGASFGTILLSLLISVPL